MQDLKKVVKTMNEISDVFKIIRRRDGIYDLYDDTRWLMSRGCIDGILGFLATTSKYSAIRIVFEDKSLEDCDEKTS